MKLERLCVSIAAVSCGSIHASADGAAVSDSTVGSAPKARRVTAAEREAALEELACRGEADATQFCQSSAAMRALTSEELELIAGTYSYTGGTSSTGGGTTTLPPVTVVPSSNPPSDPPPSNDPPPTGGAGEPPGGGGSAPTLATINVTAYSVKCQIHSQSGYSNTEYAAYLYNLNGAIHMGPLITGTQNSVGNVAFPPGVSAAQIVGFVHSHDPALCTSQGVTVTSQACVNTEYAPSNPSNSPNHQGDWGMYGSAPYDTTWGHNNQMGLYIVDPDGALRYFPPSNQNSNASGTVVSGSGC